MKVTTFDLLTGEQIECTLYGMTISCLMKLETEDGKTIIRHADRCKFDREELKRWMSEQK